MRRSKFEQIIEVLQNAVNPTPKTVLSNKTSLAFNQVQPMYDFLEERGFLERVDPPKVSYGGYRKFKRKISFLYRTTQKGLNALRIFTTNPLYELFDYYEWLARATE